MLSNITACQAVVDAVKTTLGPRGMDKLIVDAKGQATISNDGATILKNALLYVIPNAVKPNNYLVNFNTTPVGQTLSQTVTFTNTTVGDQIGYQVVGTDGVVVDMYVTGTGNTTNDATAIAALPDPTGVTTTITFVVKTGASVTQGSTAYEGFALTVEAGETTFGCGLFGPTSGSGTGAVSRQACE